MSYAEAQAATQDARIERFGIEALAGQRAFSAMGKLHRVIQADLSPTESIFGVLSAAGIKKGNISNASYAARVYDLVEAGHLTEAEYDSLAFNDCWQICRVQSKTSKRVLEPSEIAAIIRNSADFADDLESLYKNGITAEEAQAAKDKAATAKAEAEAKAAVKAEADKAELEALRATASKDKAAPEAEAKAPEAKAPEAKPKADDKKPEAKKADKAAKLTAEELIKLLDEVEAGLQYLTADGQAIVSARIAELAALTSPVAA